MAQSYEEWLSAARSRLDANLSEAAADGVAASERFGRPLKTVCRDLCDEHPEVFEAVYNRARRMSKQPNSSRGGDVTRWTQDSTSVRTARNVLKDPEAVRQVIASLPDDAVQTVAREASRRAAASHASTEPPIVRKPTVSYDDLYQHAASEIVYREADRRSGRWTPTEQTEAVRHFLIRALTDPASTDSDSLVAEITAYLEEVAS